MRIVSLVMGIALVIITYIFSSYGSYRILPVLGYVFGGILILMGLFLPSRRQMLERIKARRAAKEANADPLAILKRRYANGEITKDQYDSMKKDVS